MARTKNTTPRTKKNSKETSAAGNHLAEVTTISTRSVNLEELIRTRAYELFEQRGRELGYDFDDWLRAEAEVLQHFRARTA